jgi:hypothetical protein
MTQRLETIATIAWMKDIEMKMTLQVRYAKALESQGDHEVRRTRKYIVFTRIAHVDTFYYLGNCGSLRRGRTYSGSVPVNDKVKTAMLAVTAHLVAHLVADVKELDL